MSAQDTVNQLISNAASAADLAQEKAIAYSDQAATVSGGSAGEIAIPVPTEPNIIIPPFVNPDQDLGNEYRTEIANAFSDLDPKLTDDINDFINEWFPDFDGCLQTRTDDWLCDTIRDGATGIPVAVENAIYQRGRELLLRDAARQESEAVTDFSGRGFTLPAGVLLVRVDEIRQEATNKIAAQARDVLIKQVDVQIETIKFAVEQGIKLRLGVVTALIDFFRAKLGMYSLVKERAVSYVDAKRALWQGAAAYYQALVAAGKLHLDYDEIRIDAALQVNETHVKSFAAKIAGQVQALVAAAEAMGEIAAAAYGSQNTLAGVDHSTISSES